MVQFTCYMYTYRYSTSPTTIKTHLHYQNNKQQNNNEDESCNVFCVFFFFFFLFLGFFFVWKKNEKLRQKLQSLREEKQIEQTAVSSCTLWGLLRSRSRSISLPPNGVRTNRGIGAVAIFFFCLERTFNLCNLIGSNGALQK